MSVLLHSVAPRYAPTAGVGFKESSQLAQGLIGLIAPEGATFAERVKRRALTVNAPIGASAYGVGRRMSYQTYGVYTPAYRAWSDWEPAGDVYTFACMVELSSYNGTSSLAGNTSGSSGYFIGQRYSDGTINAMAGGTSTFGPAPAGLWRLNKPQVGVVTYDGAGTAQLFLDGNYLAQATGLPGTSYDSFCKPFLGSSLVNGAMYGIVYWGALWGRVLSRGEIMALSSNPSQLYAPELARVYRIGPLTAPGQMLRPASDIAANGWQPSTGSDLYAMLDEATANDTDYVYSPTNPTTEVVEVALTTGSTPGSGTKTLRTRLQAVGQTTRFVVELREGAALVQSFTHDVTVAEGVAAFADVVTNAITDYTALRIRVTASAPP